VFLELVRPLSSLSAIRTLPKLPLDVPPRPQLLTVNGRRLLLLLLESVFLLLVRPPLSRLSAIRMLPKLKLDAKPLLLLLIAHGRLFLPLPVIRSPSEITSPLRPSPLPSA